MTNDNPRYRFEPDARTHRARWLVTLLTLAVLAVLAQPLRAQTDNVVRVGVYNFEPLVFVDKEGAPKGLYLDALEYVAAREGWQIEYVPGTWAENLSRLEASEIDLLPSIGYTEARAEKLDFTREHLFLDWAIVYRGKGQPIETVLDLEGKTIAALKGSIYTEGLTRLLNQFDLHSPIVEMNQYTEVLAAVDRGEVDAGIITKVYGLVLEGRYSQIEATDIFFSPVKILFAVPKGQHPQILDALDRNFAALKADENSPYHTWLDKWIGIYQAKPVLPVTFLWGFAGALVLLGFLLGFAILLRRQVAQRTRELEADITARTRTEELLRESERKFRDVFESANVGKSITLPTGQVSVNRAFADWLGYSQEELTDKTWQELTPPEDITAIEAIIAPILKGDRESARFVKRYVHRDGSFLWADVSTTLRRDEAGRPLHFITTAVDITERIQAEEERSQAQKLFQMIFNLSPVATTLSSISDRVIADANNATIAWLGYTRDELVGIPSSNVDYWVNAEERQKAFSILTEQGRIADFEFVYRTKTGRTGHAVSYAEIVELGGNRYVLSSMIDITERKRAEDELRASEERFASAFRASPAGMTITRIADGKFIDANDAFCQMFEFSREEVIGHTSTELNMWSPEERKKLIEEQIRTGGLQNVELSARAKSGRLVDILFSSRPIELAGEMHHVTTMIDISERKQAQEQLAERHATLTAMLESAATPVFSLDSQYRYTSFNSVHAAVMKALYGAEIEIGESMLEYQTVLEDRQIAQENLDRALGGEQFIESGYSGEAGRARRYFEIAHNPIRDPDGNVIGVSVFASDITERERAEEALRESEAFTKAVMDNLPVGVAVNSIDPSVIFDYMNDNFPAFYRTTREALEIPDNFWDAVYEDPAFREEMKTRILADVASEEPGRMYWEDIPITRKGEQTTFVSARNVKVPGKP
ncbi:MAG: PAS domain S-box protein, partial [Caldilineaceae bacterium]|nr:PAS domain S-box protein [Caldilineaceae bacterium]